MAIKMVVPDGGSPPPPKMEVKALVSEMAAVLAAIKKEKGDKVCVAGSQIPDVERILTGCFEFDYYTGGFPRGRLSIVYGPESSGKSNVCYLAAASAQKGPEHCNKAVWVDLEGTFDPSWAIQFGVDVEKLIVIKPGYGEEAVDLIMAFLYASDVALVVVDSIAVMTAAKEVEKSAEGMDVGTASVLVKRLSNKIAICLSMEYRRGHSPAVIFVNQTRFKIGVMFGDPETMPGGQAMKFLSSLTVRLYGKNEMVKTIHPDLPVYKATNAVIKKAKVPVRAMNFEYKMAMMQTDDLRVGQTDSWNTVCGYLKAHGQLVKGDKGGWTVLGVTYPTQVSIQEKYLFDPDYQAKLQALAISCTGAAKFLVEAAK